MPGEISSGARFEVRITPEDVGKRVSVRQLADVVDGRQMFTDAVGVLTSWDDGVVCVTRRDGRTARVPEHLMVAGKLVPPPPPRRAAGVPAATARALQEVVARSWPAVETERLGEWTLRAAGGFTRRANSVLAEGDPGMPYDQALDHVTAWYAERGLPVILQVLEDAHADAVAAVTATVAARAAGAPDAAPGDASLDARLDALGWLREADTLVRTAPLAPLLVMARDDVPAPALSRTPDAAWLAAYHRTGDLGDAALTVVRGGPSVWFATMPGAIGRVVVDGRWAVFAAVEVVPELRRRGLGSSVMRELARQARAEGATAACLQVETDNTAARAMYDLMGFTDHHAYHYRRPGGPV